MPVDQRSDVLTDKIVSQFLSREHPSLAGVHEWYRPKSVKRGAGTLVDGEKQMFGLFWTWGNFTAALDANG